MAKQSEQETSLPSDPDVVLLDEAQMVTLSSPARWEVFATLLRLGPASVAEIANAMGKAPDALYYHVRQMVACGLLRSLGKRPATTRHEEIYETAFHLIKTDAANRSPAYVAARKRLVASILRAFGRRLHAALDRPVTSEQRAAEQPRIQSLLVRLGPEDADEALRRIEDLFAFVRDRSLTEEGELYAILGVSTPVEEQARPPAADGGPVSGPPRP